MKKNKAFSLVEIIIAITLIGIIAGVGTPKLRRQLAIGKDTKAIATLNIVRTASELYYSENGEPIYSKDTTNTEALKKLENYLDTKTFKNISSGYVEIGGSLSSATSKNIIYGGKVEFTFINPTSPENENDGIYLWYKPTSENLYDTKGNLWTEY